MTGTDDLAAVARAELAAIHRAPVREWHQPDDWQTPTTVLMDAEAWARAGKRVTWLPLRCDLQETIPGIDGHDATAGVA